jgi:hypothetical protein
MLIKCLLIKPSNINHLSYNDPNYIQNILELIDEIIIEDTDFINSITNYLEVNKYENKSIDIKNDIFDEEPNFIYNTMFINSIKNKNGENEDLNELNNEIGMLINKEEIIIKGNVILLKEYVPSLTNEASFSDMFKTDLERLLLNRKYKTVVVWDDNFQLTKNFREEKIINLSDYINTFFEDEEPEIKHIEFLMHKIHIYYIKCKYGNKYVCGRLLNDILIDKCLFISMKSEDIIGNITLDEVKKMIKLSEKIERYVIPAEFDDDDISTNGRIIKNNKYKILDKVFNKYC